MVGVRNKSTNQLHVSIAPLYVLGLDIKGAHGLGNAQSSSDYNVARNRLGEAFGTKKAKASIRAAERNKVDITAMSGVSGHLQEGIQSRTDALPSLDEDKGVQNANPAIPYFNADAHSPDEVGISPPIFTVYSSSQVYPLQSVISEAEVEAISSERLEQAALPYKRSVWINKHLKNLDKKNKRHRNDL
jgi:DNA-directed RNA polymerase I subunit RPA49